LEIFHTSLLKVELILHGNRALDVQRCETLVGFLTSIFEVYENNPVLRLVAGRSIESIVQLQSKMKAAVGLVAPRDRGFMRSACSDARKDSISALTCIFCAVPSWIQVYVFLH